MKAASKRERVVGNIIRDGKILLSDYDVNREVTRNKSRRRRAQAFPRTLFLLSYAMLIILLGIEYFIFPPLHSLSLTVYDRENNS